MRAIGKITSIFLCLLIVAMTFAVAVPVYEPVSADVNVSNLWGAEAEVSIDVNPTNPNNHVIVGHLLDNSSSPSRSRMNTFYTFDAGATWTRVELGVTDDGFVNTEYPDRFDPSIAFDDHGNLYVAYGVTSTGPPKQSTIIVAKSIDGGQTYTQITHVTTDPFVGVYPGNDKFHLATGPDPINPSQQNVYIAWTQFGQEGDDIDEWIAVSGSTDGGATFSAPVIINDDSVNLIGRGIFADPAVGPNGELYVSWFDHTPERILVDVSFDGGTTFGTDTLVTTSSSVYRTSIPAQPDRGVFIGPTIDTDRSDSPFKGRLYITYADLGPGGLPNTDIFMQYSDDHGATWSERTLVNDDGGTNSQFLPWLDVDQMSGLVTVVWYDARNDPNNEQVEVFMGYSNNGGVSIEPNIVVSDGQSDQSVNNPDLWKGNYLEYIGIAAYDFTAYMVWSDNSLDPLNLDFFTDKVTINTQIGELITDTIDFDDAPNGYLPVNYYSSRGVKFTSETGGNAWIWNQVYDSVLVSPHYGGVFSLPKAIAGSSGAEKGVYAEFVDPVTGYQATMDYVKVGVSSGPGADTLSDNVALIAYDSSGIEIDTDLPDTSLQYDYLTVSAPGIAKVQMVAGNKYDIFDDFTFEGIVGGSGPLGVVSHWKLDANSGSTAYDYIGSHNGNILGATWTSGINNTALNFDGVNDYVDFGNIYAFERTDTFSFDFWVKLDSKPSAGWMILARQDNYNPEGQKNSQGYNIFINSNGGISFSLSHNMVGGIGNWLGVGGTTDVVDHLFHHIAITYDGSSSASGVKIYVDSIVETLTIASDSLSDTIVGNDPFYFGAREGPAYLFNGVLDEVGIYNRVLTGSEVSQRYLLYNIPPIAIDQNLDTDEDTPLSITLTGSDATGDPLSYSIVDNPSFGTLTGTPPAVTYTPNPNYYGSDSFTFKANDGQDDSNTATISLTIHPVNDAPEAYDQTVQTYEDTPVTFTLGATDFDGDSLFYFIESWPASGGFVGSAPNLEYSPLPDHTGTVYLTFKAYDGEYYSNVATVTIGILPVNDAPVANGQSLDTDEDTSLSITLSATDTEGDTLTYSIVDSPAHGTLSGSIPTLTYTPDVNYNGPDTFTFKANDGFLDSNIATISLTIHPINDAPVANDDGVTTNEDTSIAVTLVATDVDGDSLTYSVMTGPSHGTLSGTGQTLTYTPDPDYNGPDSFTFMANDGFLDSNTATISITVDPVNDAPEAYPQSLNTDEDITLSITPIASDIDGDILTLSIVDNPTHGTLSGTIANADLTYTPDADYFGLDEFTFKANDGLLDSNAAAIEIMVDPVNDAPVAIDDSVITNEDTPTVVTLSATDIEGDSLTLSIITSPSHGTLSGSGGTPTYTPDADYNGPDSFTFNANDGEFDSNTATISLTILPVNDAPIANDHPEDTDEDIAVAITLTGSDIEGDSLTFMVVSGPTQGTLSGTAPDLIYTPDANYYGTDSFTFLANDGLLDSNIATISLTIHPINDAPVAFDDSKTTNEDTSMVITMGAMDFDGDTLLYSIVSTPSHGVLSGTEPILTYTPDADYNGPDSFTFRANDGIFDSNTATVNITVIPVNDAPVALGQAVTTDEDIAVAITLSATDIDGDPLSYSFMSMPTLGSLSGIPPSLTFTPYLNQYGSDSFIFRAYDGGLYSNPAVVSITINPVNDAPVASSGSDKTANEGAQIFFSGSYTDPELQDTHTIAWDFGDGSTSSGSLTPTHVYGDNGVYTVTLTVTDNNGAAGSDTLTITANNVAPTISAGSDQTVNEGDIVSFSGSFFDDGLLDTHSIDWDFGDGTTVSGTLTPSHVYSDNGEYDVTLSVTDDDGGIGSGGLLEEWMVTSNIEPIDIEIDSSGNVYLLGYIFNSHTRSDIVTIAYNSDGSQLWSASYDSSAHNYDTPVDLEIDASGNVYVTSTSYVTGYRYTTIAYDSTGTQIWIAHYPPSGGGFTAVDLEVDLSGNVYITGTGSGSYGDHEYMTVAYDSSGTQLWATAYDDPNTISDMPVDLEVDSVGNVYVTGNCRSVWTNYDYTTVAYDSSGTQLWVAKYYNPGNNPDHVTAMAVDSLDNIYVTGYSWNSGTERDYATVAYDSSGNELWVARYNGPAYGNDIAWDIDVNSMGTIYVTGYSHSTGSFLDYVTIAYDSSGNELWVSRYNSHRSVADLAGALAVDSAGNVFVTGYQRDYSNRIEEAYLTVAHDSSGNLIDAILHDTPLDRFIRFADIEVDISGNIYVVLRSYLDGTGFGSTITKYTPPVSQTLKVTVNNVAPTPSIDSIAQPFPNFIMPLDLLDFTGSFSDPGTADTHTFEWEFGDGTTASGNLTPAHSYAKAGNYTVNLTVTDDDGDSGSVSTIVTVLTPQSAAEDIVTDVEDLGLPEGTENSFVSKLESAIRSLANDRPSAAGQLQAFINEVEAQKDKALSIEQANKLIAAAQYIIDNM
jgi:PKD repeat protein